MLPEPPRFKSLPEAGMWSSFKLDCRYCWKSLKAVSVEHDWGSAMKAVLLADKGLKELLGGGLVFLVLNVAYFYFVFPLVGVAWTVVVYLCLLCAFLWACVHAARVYHEIKTSEYNASSSMFGDQITEALNRNEEIRLDKEAQERENEALKAALGAMRREVADLKQRPEITGGIYDLFHTYYYDETKIDQEMPRPIGTQLVLSIWLRNNNPTPTTLHNFKFQWEALGKTWEAQYAEEVTIHRDRDIWPTNEIARRNSRLVNLSSYLGSKSFAKDARVEGYLGFRLAG